MPARRGVFFHWVQRLGLMMATVTRLVRSGREGFRVRFYDAAKRRREIYIPGSGRRVERLAQTVAGHCEALAKAKANNILADPAAAAWADGTEGGLRENLIAWGLADPRNPKLATDAGRLLGPFVDGYLESRTDWAKKTGENHRQVNNYLKTYFGPQCVLKSITVGDAERWHRWLATDCGLSPATVSKHGKRAKMMFASAVSDRLLAQNPFAGLKAGKESNPGRFEFITPEMAALVLDACPDADWRLIFSLCRWGGLRCPSEVLALRWRDVDWAAGRLRIESPKTGLRFAPMFPQVRTALAEAFEAAPEGAEFCVGRYRDKEANLRTQFSRIIERAGLVPWGKPFQNLRSSRRTELEEQFPNHVINGWLGHSSRVAEGHYLQTTDEHWKRATDAGSVAVDGDGQDAQANPDSRSPTGPPIDDNQGPSGPIAETKKPRENRGSDGCRWVRIGSPIPPAGFEQPSETRKKSSPGRLVPPPVPPSLAILDPEAEELLAIWAGMDDRARADLLAAARGLAGVRA